MGQPLKLVVGLGNPGPNYAQTRHNAGFWFVERLAADRGAVFRSEAKFLGEVAQLPGGIWLLKPTTFMNRSGQAVGAFLNFYRLQPEQILVAHDELDLPGGSVKLKQGGGHGGHNGLRDIISHLGGNNFLRLRLGVGHPGHKDGVVDHVLDRPNLSEQRAIDDAIAAALAVMPQALAGELNQAMQALHSPR